MCPLFAHLSGTDYFVGGSIARISGPIAHFFFRRRYGGLAAIDPARHPIHPGTGLAVGDVTRMAWIFAGPTFIGMMGTFFLPWYDDPQYFADMYGIEGLFDALIACIRWLTAVSAVVAVALWAVGRRLDPAGAAGRPSGA